MAGNDANTIALWHFDGANGATTGAGFADDSVGGSTHDLTVSGSAQISTAQSKFGGSSLALSGTDYVFAADSDDWYFASGDFTLDGWIYLNSLPTSGNQYMVLGQFVDGVNFHVMSIFNDAGTLKWDWRCYYGGGYAFRVLAAPVSGFSTGSWFHFACVMDSGTARLFTNGTDELTAARSKEVANFSIPWRVGRLGTAGSVFSLDGYIDEVRVSDVARWTADFTPPIEAYTVPQDVIKSIRSRIVTPINKVPSAAIVW